MNQIKQHWNILLVGCGGREHAYYSALQKAGFSGDIVDNIYCYTGELSAIDNVGIRNPALHVKYINDLSNLHLCNPLVDFAIIGSEKHLQDGVVDILKTMNIPSIGPSANLAKIETSKMFARSIIEKINNSENNYNPKLVYLSASDLDKSISLEKIYHMLNTFGYNGIVVKDDGLASGKGVKTTFISNQEVVDYIKSRFDNGNTSSVLIEEKLYGQEFSLMSWSDGIKLSHMPIVVDYKTESTTNPLNTGGYGSVLTHPSYFGLTSNDITISQRLNQFVIDELHLNYSKNNEKYVGIIYGSYMKTNDGIKVIEYNARGGDSEIINILDNMKTPFIDVCIGMISGNLPEINYKIDTYNGKYNDKYNNDCVSVFKYYVPIGYPDNISDFIKMIPINMSFFHGSDTHSKLPRLGLNAYQKGGIIISGLNYNRDSYGVGPNIDYCYLTGSRAIGFIGRGESVEDCLDAIDKIYHYMLHNATGLLTLENKPLLKSSNSIGQVYSPIDNTTLCQLNREMLTYKSVGVDDEKVANILRNCKDNVKSTFNNHVSLNTIGGFYGQYDNIVASMDGVGTKSMLALEYSTNLNKTMSDLAEDLFYCVYNDILVAGCLKPMFFLDYFGSNGNNVELLEPLIAKLSEICVKHKCVLLGGETAIMPDVYKDNINIIGMVVGEKDGTTEGHKKISWVTMKAGDNIYGLKSSGPHTNGYTLIRKVIENYKKITTEPIPHHIMSALLAPCRDYSNHVTKFNTISGMAHITGGGFSNIERVLPDNISCEIDCNSWQVPECYNWLKFNGNIAVEEMYRVFNMGLGYIVITPDTIQSLESESDIILIGKVINGNGKIILHN